MVDTIHIECIGMADRKLFIPFEFEPDSREGTKKIVHTKFQ